MSSNTYVKADGDIRCISIKRVEAGSYVVMLDHVAITDATINKVGNGWEITSIPGDDIHMPFRTLTDAKAHLLSWFRFHYIPTINAAHAEAVTVTPYRGTRTIAAIKAEGVVSRMDYPVPFGRPVTEAHTRICREFGCASYVKNGMDMGYCPRCGEVTTSEEQISDEIIARAIEQEKALAAIEPFESPVTFDDDLTGPVVEPFTMAERALNALAPIKSAAEASMNALTSDDSRFDAAYQVWQDLARAMDEVERTIGMMREGMI